MTPMMKRYVDGVRATAVNVVAAEQDGTTSRSTPTPANGSRSPQWTRTPPSPATCRPFVRTSAMAVSPTPLRSPDDHRTCCHP